MPRRRAASLTEISSSSRCFSPAAGARCRLFGSGSVCCGPFWPSTYRGVSCVTSPLDAPAARRFARKQGCIWHWCHVSQRDATRCCRWTISARASKASCQSGFMRSSDRERVVQPEQVVAGDVPPEVVVAMTGERNEPIEPLLRENSIGVDLREKGDRLVQ